MDVSSPIMSANTVDLSRNFSPEEWTLIESAPFLAGLSVTLSDLRSGLFGAIKESFAPSQAIMEAGTGASNPIVASVAASIKKMATKRQKLQLPLSVAGKKPEEVKAEVAAQLTKIPAILEGKVPADQAEGFKSWLVASPERLPMRRPRVDSLGSVAKGSAQQKPQQSTNWLRHSV